MASATSPSTMEDFAALLDETLGRDSGFEGSVVTGRVLRLTDEFAIVDVGLKSEGRVALKEFATPGVPPDVKPGDVIELFVERYEDRDGTIVLSREKARREESWTNLEKAFEANQRVTGTIYGRVKGGFTVDLGGAVAFLPGSQVDIRPVRDVGPLMGQPQPFQILKMDRARGNIVVSRRAVLEETRAERSSISAAWTACCMSPTSHGAASTIRRKPCRSACRSRCRSSASTATPSASAWA